ncbi:relaxase/mobilization nuclease domain-containing protein [Jannaschia sp. R86511]|uniref:relaxase/mobilization nuclease domain-containing protein n=1 Tax=Jannaschia sp. R86511 TaxID=3093853 RepID=UPI0036D2DD4D
MPNITRGERMGGLMAYLQGPGRANEHTEPHLVAGDPAVMAWHDDAVLDRSTALAIAAELDHPRRLFGVEVAGGSVWHCSLSLRAEEGLLSDEKWAAIAHEFVDGMGFSDDTRQDEHGEMVGRAGCRWVAVRHGVSTNGNDHVHIAVSLVREDGTKASVWNDRRTAQRVAGELERKHGLEVLESRTAARGARGVKPAEVATAQRRGDVEPARVALARAVRAHAGAAADEAEFVRRLRRAGLLVRPRFAAGRDDVVAGYSVALRVSASGARGAVGERPVWYGGGHLDKDLSLPRLRREWPDTPSGASEAVAEWNAGRRGARPVMPGRETQEPAPELWQEYGQGIAALREQLRQVPVSDRATWAHVAHETAGAFAAWSVRVEDTPGPLAEAAQTIARSAHLRAGEVHARRATSVSAVKGTTLLLASLARGGQGTVAQAILLRHLMNLAKAIHDAHRATGEAQRAAQIAAVAREQLRLVQAGLPAPRPGTEVSRVRDVPEAVAADAELVRLARAGMAPVETAPARAPGSPVPTKAPTAPDSTRPRRPVVSPAASTSEVER